MTILIILAHIIFGLYFIYTGNTYYIIIPLIVLISIAMTSRHRIDVSDLKSWYIHNMLEVSRSLIMIAILGLLYTMGLGLIYSCIAIIALNMGLMLGSMYIRNEEAWYLSRRGLMISAIIWGCISAYAGYIYHSLELYMQMQSVLIICGRVRYMWLDLVIGSMLDVPSEISFLDMLFTYLAIITAILSLLGFTNLRSWGVVSIIAIGCNLAIYYISIYHQNTHNPQDIDLKYILQGKKILELPKNPEVQFYESIYTYIKSHTISKYLPNIIYSFTIIISIIIYIYGYIQAKANSGADLLIIVLVSLYIYNYYISHQHDNAIYIQKIISILLVNFLGYIFIIIGIQDVMLQLICAIIWNISSNIILYNLEELSISYQISMQDMYRRIGSNIIAMCINIYFIASLNIDSNIRFLLSVLMIGVWIMGLAIILRKKVWT